MNNINDLLNTVYELEGLLHLSMSRDEMPEKLPDLILKKVNEISKIASETFKVGSEESLSIMEEDTETEPNTSGFEDILYEYNEEEDKETVTYSEIEAETEENEIKEIKIGERPNDVKTSRKQFSAPSYSINDRFLFIRELFGGNTRDFNKAMEAVADFDTFEEAETYFLDELNFNENDETVERFLEILDIYFRTR